MALLAIERRLIEPRALWDAACRWTLGGATSPRELFTGLLPPDQIDELYRAVAPPANASGAPPPATPPPSPASAHGPPTSPPPSAL